MLRLGDVTANNGTIVYMWLYHCPWYNVFSCTYMWYHMHGRTLHISMYVHMYVYSYTNDYCICRREILDVEIISFAFVLQSWKSSLWGIWYHPLEYKCENNWSHCVYTMHAMIVWRTYSLAGMWYISYASRYKGSGPVVNAHFTMLVATAWSSNHEA